MARMLTPRLEAMARANARSAPTWKSPAHLLVQSRAARLQHAQEAAHGAIQMACSDAARLAASKGARRARRHAIESRGDGDQITVLTRQAEDADRRVTLSVPELHALMRASRPALPALAITRKSDAALRAAIGVALDLLAQESASASQTIQAATCHGVRALAEEAAAWLGVHNVVVVERWDRCSDDLSARPRDPLAWHRRPRKASRQPQGDLPAQLPQPTGGFFP